jgi:nitrogen regulatory protein P-II 1
MKKIEIIIPDRYLNEANRILKEAHTGGITHYRVEGRGKVKAQPVAIDRGTRQYTPEFIPRTKIEVVVKDEQLNSILDHLSSSMNDPSLGGKIFVVDVPIAIDLATSQRGEQAVA